MSDFIDHLLGESQGQVASLAPRPLALHEPAPEPAAPPLDEAALAGGGLPGPDALAAARFRPAPPAAPPPEPGRVPPDPAGEMRRRLDELQAWLGQLSSQRAEPPALAAPLPAPVREAGPTVQPVLGEPRPPASAPAAPVTVVREVTAHTPVPPPTAAPRATPPQPAASLRARPAPPEPQAGPRRAARSSQAQAPEPAMRPAAAPPASPPQETAPARLTPRPPEPAGLPEVGRLPLRQVPEPAPRPVVHVSIGRIEVRAARPPAPAVTASPSRPSPVLSLEEYLRQRNGGGR